MMKINLNWLVIILALFSFVSNIVAAIPEEVSKLKKNDKVMYLEAGNTVDFTPQSSHRGIYENDLRIYCFAGKSKSISSFFKSIELQIDIDNDEYTQYKGVTSEEVRNHYEQQKSIFNFNIFSQKSTRQQLSPFEQQCIGVETLQPYRIHLKQQRVDFLRLLQVSIAIAFFVYAGILSNNALFYYMTGIILGICLSFMLVIWLTSKLVPKRPMMYGMLFGGWAIGMYIIQLIWENFQVIIVTYQSYVIWYVLITGIVSFCVCYRMGPPKHKRSKEIIKWILQFLGLTAIYFSSSYEEAAIAVCALLILFYYFPRSWLRKVYRLYLRYFPPKPRLLTQEEFAEQGVRETSKALDELRKYANSPDCKQWKIMSKLRDPLRFAQFVEGSAHLRDEEILQYEDTQNDTQLDETDISEDNGNISEEDDNEKQNVIYYNNRFGQRSYSSNSCKSENLSEDEDNGIVEHHHVNYMRNSTMQKSNISLLSGDSIEKVLPVPPQLTRLKNFNIQRLTANNNIYLSDSSSASDSRLGDRAISKKTTTTNIPAAGIGNRTTFTTKRRTTIARANTPAITSAITPTGRSLISPEITPTRRPAIARTNTPTITPTDSSSMQQTPQTPTRMSTRAASITKRLR